MKKEVKMGFAQRLRCGTKAMMTNLHVRMTKKTPAIKFYTSKNLPRNTRVCVFGPHPDDAAISLGGTLHMLTRPHEKNNVFSFALTSGHRGVGNHHDPKINRRLTPKIRAYIRKRETRAADKIIGIKTNFLDMDFYEKGKITALDMKKAEEALQAVKPKIIFMPAHGDIKQETHQFSHELLKRAINNYVRKTGEPLEIWFYETPYYSLSPRMLNVEVELAEKSNSAKIASLGKLKSQTARTNLEAEERLGDARKGIVEQELKHNGNRKILTKISPVANFSRCAVRRRLFGVSWKLL